MTTENNVTDQTPAPKPTQPSIFDQMDVNPITNEVVIPVPESPAETPETPETPEVTIPFNVPDALKPKEPETQTASEIESLKNENAELKRGQAETLRIQTQNKNATSIQDLTQQYINTFQLDETTARFTATQVISERQQGEAKVADANMLAQIEVGRRNAASHYGKQYGVDPTALANLDSPAEMEREAKWIVYANSNDKRVSAVEASRVEDGAYDSASSGAAPLNVAQLLAASADPDFVLTPAQQKQISQHLGLDT